MQVQTEYDAPPRRGRRGLGLPAAAVPGKATLALGAVRYPIALANGAILPNEDHLRPHAEAAAVLARGGMDADLLPRLLRVTVRRVGEAKPPVWRINRFPPDTRRYLKAMLAGVLAQETFHGVQLVACSRPAQPWRNSERRRCEIEADVGGMLLPACAGHPLEALLAAEVTHGIMDAVARSQGVREATYPSW